MKFEYSRWRPHPWHGLNSSPNPPSDIHAFVEITPFDLVKYEVDKTSGYLRLDRSQQTSSLPPALYGFIPQTCPAERVASLMPDVDEGDLDPLDVCVLSERPISRAEVIVRTRVVGGIPMVDGGQADDKIVGILRDDPVFGEVHEIGEVPNVLIDRLIQVYAVWSCTRSAMARLDRGSPKSWRLWKVWRRTRTGGSAGAPDVHLLRTGEPEESTRSEAPTDSPRDLDTPTPHAATRRYEMYKRVFLLLLLLPGVIACQPEPLTEQDDPVPILSPLHGAWRGLDIQTVSAGGGSHRGRHAGEPAPVHGGVLHDRLQLRR